MRGVILYGPPASGKDTVTDALEKLDASYTLFPKLKVGSGRRTGYRTATHVDLDRLRGDGELIWENRRYGAVYAIDRPSLLKLLPTHTPIVHLGQSEGIRAISAATPTVRWLVVYLWCSRDVARHRIVARNTGDAEDRLRVWDETESISHADIAINTETTSPETAAHQIDRQLRRTML